MNLSVGCREDARIDGVDVTVVAHQQVRRFALLFTAPLAVEERCYLSATERRPRTDLADACNGGAHSKRSLSFRRWQVKHRPKISGPHIP
jgi:hypothetical protein